MIHFALAIGQRSSCTNLAQRLATAVRHTAILGGEVVEAVSPTGTWAFAAIAEADAFGAIRWHADDDAIAVTNGCVVERGGLIAPEKLLARYRSGGIAAARDALVGTFNLVCVDAEQGLAMTGDVAGLFPLYHGADAGVVVISNRSTTVAHALGLDGWNLRTLAWLVSMSLIAGEDVPIEGVRAMPPGRVARVAPGRAVLTIEPGSHPTLRSAGTDPGRTELHPDEWDQITDDLIGEMRALAAIDVPMALPITGGKDSRLLLALAKAAGLTDLLTYTTGAPTDPEVLVAAGVAAVAGFEHGIGVPDAVSWSPTRHAVVGPGPGDTLDTKPWHRLSRALGRYEGIVPAWAAFKTPIAPATLILKGWGGENYRFRSRMVPCADRYLDGQAPVTDGVEVLARFYANRVDPLRVLVPDERERQIAWFHQRVHTAAQDLRLDLVPDDVWLSNKSNQYQGAVMQGTPTRPIANPLVNGAALGRYAELGLGVRRTDRLHYEVMRRAAPELIGLPFHEQTWSPEIRMSDPATRTHRGLRGDLGARAALASSTSEGVVRSWVPGHRAWSVVRRTERRARVGPLGATPLSTALRSGNEPVWALVNGEPTPVVALLREAADAGLASICDVDRLCGFVTRPPRFTRREELQVADALGVALLLLGRTERVVDTV